jgi:hypothetical protein
MYGMGVETAKMTPKTQWKAGYKLSALSQYTRDL